MLAVLSAIAGNVLLFALVFGMSATVDINCMRTQMRNVKAIMTGIFCQFIVLPLLGFMVVKLFLLELPEAIALLTIVSSPGGSYSNWWCSMFNGDLALSVTMTAASTLLSVIFLPLNLLIYTRFSYEADVIGNLDWKSVFIALILVIAAIALGLYCSANSKSVEFNKRANQLGNLAGFLLIIFSATITNTGDSDTKIWSRSLSFYIGVALPCILGIALANMIASAAKLQKPEQVTVAIECCYQNVGIASSMALSMFQGRDLNHAMGVPFYYGVCEMVLVGLYCVAAWKLGYTKAPRDAPFWKVISTSYEVLEIEEKIPDDNTGIIEVSENSNEGATDYQQMENQK